MRFHPRHIPLPLLSASILTASIVGLASWTLASKGESATDPHSPLGVAETLNSLVQPRFFKFDDERFGMSRIAVVQKRHPIERFAPESNEEKEQFASLVSSKRDYMVLFYRTATPPPNARPSLSSKEAEFRFVVGTLNQHSAFLKVKTDWYPVVNQQLFRLQRGIPVNREVGDWLLAMRPVKNNEQCVSCHLGSRPEDMLGIMVYAVRKTKPEGQKAIPAITARQTP